MVLKINKDMAGIRQIGWYKIQAEPDWQQLSETGNSVRRFLEMALVVWERHHKGEEQQEQKP
jgi:hypothetical protein